MLTHTSYARVASRADERLYAPDLDPPAWRRLQETYQLGQLLMPCCNAPAVPKTSSLGLQFFSHPSGAYGAAPESIWHQQAKEAVAAAARQLGYRAIIERPGPDWTADVWVEHPSGPAVVECQHSYQHLREYLARQQRYRDAGIRCLWLVIPARLLALGQSTGKQRARTDLKGLKKWPAEEGNLLPDFPAAALVLEPVPAVRGSNLAEDLAAALAAFLEGRFLWTRGRWLVDGVASHGPEPGHSRLHSAA